MSTATLTMYSTTWCGYCKRLKNQLNQAGIIFTEINIEEVPGAAKFVEQVNNGNQTVPTVVYADGSAATNPSVNEVIHKLKILAREGK
jgi:mycoredoxin